MYLIMGIAYRRIMTGAQGIEQIPHYYFWRDLGNLQAVSIVMSVLSNLAPCFLTLPYCLFNISYINFFASCHIVCVINTTFFAQKLYILIQPGSFFSIYYTLLLKHDLGWVCENAYSISRSSNKWKCFYVQQSKLL